jgi:predicted metalloendopeptidase
VAHRLWVLRTKNREEEKQKHLEVREKAYKELRNFHSLPNRPAYYQADQIKKGEVCRAWKYKCTHNLFCKISLETNFMEM